MFLQELDTIERVIAFACRRHRLEGADADDFAASVKLRLLEDDYAVLRAFQGRSSFSTYIHVVVQRMLLDFRIHEWGKWHSSAEAKRLGKTAIRIEQLLRRDGRSIDEALAVLRADDPEFTRESLLEIEARLPERQPKRRMVSIDEAQQVHADGTTDAPIAASERHREADRVSHLLRRFIDGLPDDDRLLLQLRFDSEMSVAQIARSLRTEQKPLYRRMEKLLERLRADLQDSGVDATRIRELIGHRDTVFDFHLRNAVASPAAADGGSTAPIPKEIPR